ncbi:MAG: YeeE/YedE family protein [Deltaproteobacteria bacterium RBG_19FT_COMBO_46_12]|nr:MAG: YeeE/YedE family protein [Deltaproteobacteria bacterium RBG_19FT_COMBO_46_12]
MFKTLHAKKDVQLVIGLLIGILFGFFLQKGGVTRYDVIIGQLLLRDFTVVKVMLTAVVVGKIGVHLLKSLGRAELHPKPGSLGSTVIGGLLFGIGFGILGYCPGTMVGAVGQGSLDALFGGIVGLLIGVGLFSEIYPALEKKILFKGDFGDLTFPRLFKVNPWVLIIPLALGIIAFLIWIEISGW